MPFDPNAYRDEFVRQNYDRVNVTVGKGKKAVLRELAEKYNVCDDRGRISVNRLIIDAVEEKYGVDLTTKE